MGTLDSTTSCPLPLQLPLLPQTEDVPPPASTCLTLPLFRYTPGFSLLKFYPPPLNSKERNKLGVFCLFVFFEYFLSWQTKKDSEAKILK